MGPKQSKLGDAKPPAGMGKTEYESMVKAEQERMLTVSSAPSGSVQQNEILDRLAKLEPIEAFMPAHRTPERKLDQPTVHVLEADDLIDMAAGFQTHTRQCSVHLLNGAFSIGQDMRDCKQLCENLEKRVSTANASLAKLQLDMTGVSKLEQTIQVAESNANKCIARIEAINNIISRGRPVHDGDQKGDKN
eukprot:TRINITY_DN18754_c0_g1_i1.p1 TRINITY_DN18754_c0_g1~~TRINITY_DN18754_c0_g1_i1.p1  ORF type:complete len:191 (+),score=28.09 TRINITY_DN18754_c0_g1_i1:85-657(+)